MTRARRRDHPTREARPLPPDVRAAIVKALTEAVVADIREELATADVDAEAAWRSAREARFPSRIRSN